MDNWGDLYDNNSSQSQNESGNSSVGISCPDHTQYQNIFLHGSVGIAAVIVLVFSFLEKRTQKCLKCCGGRPGIAIPLNMLDDYENRWGYAFAFGAVTNTVIVIFTDGPNLQFEGPLIAKITVSLLTAIEICVNLFPFFACLSTDRKILGSVIGFLYAGLWFGVLLFFTLTCLDPAPELLPFIGLIIQLPTLICLTLLMGCYVYIFSITVHKKRTHKHKLEDEDAGFPKIVNKWQQDYVKNLFKDKTSITEEGSTLTLKQKCSHWINKYVYSDRPYFQYSARILCSLFVVGMTTYQLGVAYYWFNTQAVDWFSLKVDILLELVDPSNNSSSVRNIQISTDILRIGWRVVTGVTLILFILDTLAILGYYRSHMLRLFRGDQSFLPNNLDTDPGEVMRCCMLYSGFQVGYMIWGFFVLNFVMWLLTLIFGFVIVLPAMNQYYDILINIAEIAVIPFVMNFLLRIVQKLMARALFLQPKINSSDKSKPLALNNRKIFHVVNYFFFFANIATGLFSCLLRILEGFAFGLLYLGRIDRCVLMPGREPGDRGFNAYVGMLRMELTHNHPVLRVFCQHLINTYHQRVLAGELTVGGSMELNSISQDGTTDLGMVPVEGDEEKLCLKGFQQQDGYRNDEKAVSGRARRRWHLIYTLLHNPHLIPLRHFHMDTEQEQLKRKRDVQAVIARKQRYNKLKLELDALEKEIKGDMIDTQACEIPKKTDLDKANTSSNNLIDTNSLTSESSSHKGSPREKEASFCCSFGEATTNKISPSVEETSKENGTNEEKCDNITDHVSEATDKDTEHMEAKPDDEAEDNQATSVTADVVVKTNSSLDIMDEITKV